MFSTCLSSFSWLGHLIDTAEIVLSQCIVLTFVFVLEILASVADQPNSFAWCRMLIAHLQWSWWPLSEVCSMQWQNVRS